MKSGGASGLCVLQVMECTIGGTRRHLVDVARGLRRAGIEVHLAVAAERQASFRETLGELATEGIVVHEIPMERSISPGRDARHMGRIADLLRVLRPDVIHTHSSKAGVLGRFASLRTGIARRVHTPHTFAFLFREMFGPAKRALFRSIEKGLAARTDAVVAVSAGEAATFAASGVVPSDRIRVIPNGIDPAPFADASPVDLARVGLDPERPTAAVVGLLNVAKGQDLALDALARLGGDLQILFAGSGEDREALEARAARLGLRERVAFLGFREDVPQVLAACDFLLLPSRWEGMPYIVLEAMASSKPVVATPVDGARDLVLEGRTGVLAHASTAEAIAEALAEFLALDEVQRAELGRAGRTRVEEGFTTETMVAGLIELYGNLTGKEIR